MRSRRGLDSQQGRSGLGLEAQREAVRLFLAGHGGALAEAFTAGSPE